MSSTAAALQAVIYDALTGDAALDALIEGRVYDSVPVNSAGQLTAEFPYITIRDMQVVDDGADCVDGEEIYIDVHVWTRTVGLIASKRIGAAVKAVLHDADLELGSGFNFLSILFRDALYRMESDGITGHGILTFVALAETT